jgi:hypothetical protein
MTALPLHVRSPADYVDMTWSTAERLFSALRETQDQLKQFNSFDIGFRSQDPETMAAANTDADMERNHRIAQAFLCGSLLQVANTGLRMCSFNNVIPPSCVAVTSDLRMAKYCVGREVCGLPIGALIHAGRNQATHWDDEQEYDASSRRPAGFNAFTQAAFDHLAREHWGDMFLDLAFALGNDWYGGIPNRAASLFHLFRWHDQAAFNADLCDMLGVPSTWRRS